MFLGQFAHLTKVESVKMNTVFIACIGLTLFASKAECTISVWTEPDITGGNTGTAAFSTSPVAEGTAFTVTVAATTDASTITYAITSQTPAGWATLTSAGVLTVSSGEVLNFESPGPSYEVVITATDVASDGTTETTGVATCSLVVTNVNEAPAFTGTSLTGTIVDAASAGIALATYPATDPDASDVVTYSIASGDCNSDFNITTTGAVSVATGKTLSASTTPCYSLVLKAVDDDTTPLTGSTTVLVTVGSSTCSGTYSCNGAAAVTAGIMTVIMGLFITIMK